MASAGLLNKVARLLKIEQLKQVKEGFNLADLLPQLQYNLARASVSSALQLSVNGKIDGGVSGMLMDAALSTVLEPMLSKVDGWHKFGEVNETNRQIVHGVVGGVKGIIKDGSSDALGGFVSGAAQGLLSMHCTDAFGEHKEVAKGLDLRHVLLEDPASGSTIVAKIRNIEPINARSIS